jgi:hypothetical protein
MSDLDTEQAEELAALRGEPAADTGVHPEDGDQEPADEEPVTDGPTKAEEPS